MNRESREAIFCHQLLENECVSYKYTICSFTSTPGTTWIAILWAERAEGPLAVPTRIKSPYWILLRKVRSPRCGIPTFEASKRAKQQQEISIFFSLTRIYTQLPCRQTRTPPWSRVVTAQGWRRHWEFLVISHRDCQNISWLMSNLIRAFCSMFYHRQQAPFSSPGRSCKDTVPLSGHQHTRNFQYDAWFFFLTKKNLIIFWNQLFTVENIAKCTRQSEIPFT